MWFALLDSFWLLDPALISCLLARRTQNYKGAYVFFRTNQKETAPPFTLANVNSSLKYIATTGVRGTLPDLAFARGSHVCILPHRFSFLRSHFLSCLPCPSAFQKLSLRTAAKLSTLSLRHIFISASLLLAREGACALFAVLFVLSLLVAAVLGPCSTASGLPPG